MAGTVKTRRRKIQLYVACARRGRFSTCCRRTRPSWDRGRPRAKRNVLRLPLVMGTLKDLSHHPPPVPLGGRGWGTLLMKLCCELALKSRASLHGHWPWQHSLYSFLDTCNAQQSTRRIFEIKAFKNQGPVANSISDSAEP
ncbi:unnamed protein product [Natator depressus]